MRKQVAGFSDTEKARALNLAGWIEYKVPDPDDKLMITYVADHRRGKLKFSGGDAARELAVMSERELPDGSGDFDAAMKNAIVAARQCDEEDLEDAQTAEGLWDVVKNKVVQDIAIPNMPRNRKPTVLGFQLALIIATWDMLGAPPEDPCHPSFVGPVLDADWQNWRQSLNFPTAA